MSSILCDSDEGLDRSSSYSYMSSSTKVVHDMIHHQMKIPDLCCKIVNTPQFQRLRNLKQLGVCYYVYPSASHNRFEHCIGTCYLAGMYGRTLQRNQPELKIDSVDIICLEIAGLCHDIGHGPFSHTWESFMKCYKSDYSHEEMSIRMFDFVVEENQMLEYFEMEGIKEKDLTFIKELILGHPLPGNASFVGRDMNKYFLYQIISNDETKIDVDKFDYLLRDCKQLNVSTAFDFQRVIDNTFVFPVTEVINGETVTKKKIAYRKKIRSTLEDLFVGRYNMHQKAYQHKVIKIIEEMVVDGLNAAEPLFEVPASDGTKYRLSTAYQDLSAFMKLTDGILELFVNWKLGGENAYRIFDNILHRNLYKSFGYTTEMPEEVEKKLSKTNPNLIVIQSKFNYGKGKENPLNSALFYEKSRPSQTFHLEFSPPPLESKYYIVYRPMARKESSAATLSPWIDLNTAKVHFKEWAEENGIKIETE